MNKCNHKDYEIIFGLEEQTTFWCKDCGALKGLFDDNWTLPLNSRAVEPNEWPARDNPEN